MTYTYKDIGKRLSNRGRWGDEDERGTLNHLTPERVKASTDSVRSGRVFELSIPVSGDGPQNGAGNRHNPIHLMTIMPADIQSPDNILVADDFVAMPLQSGTHWDGLAHVGYDDETYNGVTSSSIHALGGAQRNSIDKTLPGMVGRGVLLDIARLHDRPWLELDHGITPDELEAAEKAAGVQVGPGDALLFRTGWRRKALEEGWNGWLSAEPGLTVECAEWLYERDVATIASDNWGIEVQPASDGMLPLHCVLIRDMGMMLGEIFDLEALAEDCANDGQYDFQFIAPALRVHGGTGSPVSPIVIK
ncbi:cyclase family protein [Rhodococcus koreensis]